MFDCDHLMIGHAFYIGSIADYMCEHWLDYHWHDDVGDTFNDEKHEEYCLLVGHHGIVKKSVICGSAWHKQVAPADHDSVC